MIVVSCPPKLTGAEGRSAYDNLGRKQGKWYHAGGPRFLMNYLLTLDLDGWRPPSQPPMTAEKYMAYMESLTPVQTLAEDMKTANMHTVMLWLDQAMGWAKANMGANDSRLVREARATEANVANFRVRPFYSPTELSYMFPAILFNTKAVRQGTQTGPAVISKELRQAGIKYLENKDDPRGFRYHGKLEQFLIIAERDDWSALTQAEFDRVMAQAPSYAAIKAGKP